MSAWRIVASCTNICSHSSGGGADDLRKLLLHAPDLVPVHLELILGRPAALAQLADGQEPAEMQRKIVDRLDRGLNHRGLRCMGAHETEGDPCADEQQARQHIEARLEAVCERGTA